MNPGGEDQHSGDALALRSSLWARAGGRKCCYSLDCLTAMGAIGSQIIRGRQQHLTVRSKVGAIIKMSSRVGVAVRGAYSAEI